MQDQAGRRIVITGANTGIGKITALELAKRGANIVLACRSRDKTQPVIEEIKQATGNAALEFLDLDLGDLASVRAAAKTLLGGPKIHTLINNAGLAGKRGLTKDGFELAFGTNHLGHFLLTELVRDHLQAPDATTPARIVNVASRSHYQATGIPWQDLRTSTKSITGLPEYSVSKLANVLHAQELARRLDPAKVTTYSLHPGVVATDVWRQVPAPVRWVMKRFMISSEDGAQTTLHCATSPKCTAETGLYYDKSAVKRPNRITDDAALAAELWTRSEKMVAGTGS